ncbi:MAG: hypothetical protein JWN00_5586 [Actinomycetia bacterium]|nr:hypothetical protein [Actinomycetes bacterium]
MSPNLTPARTKPPYGQMPSQWDLRTLTKMIGPHLEDEGPLVSAARIARTTVSKCPVTQRPYAQ